MGKPTKWLKNVLLGKKPSKSNASKGKEIIVSGKEVVVTAKVEEESDVVTDLLSLGNAVVTSTDDRSIGTQNVEPEEIVQVAESGRLTDSENAAPMQDNLQSDEDRVREEIAATCVQAAFRGYLARRAFWALKGIIRLQALIRGHLVRRQAVATLCCVMGIVRLQAIARGKEFRNSDIGVQVQRNCRLHLLQDKQGTDGYFGIKKLTGNAFALKLLASSPRVLPVHAPYDTSSPNSNSIWLENWSASCFWKPVPQPTGRKPQKKVEVELVKPKKSVRKVPAANLEISSLQTPFEFEKPKRNFRKVSSQSIEPLAVENPQIELEKVKRSLRKVHNPVVESSIQPQQVSPHVEEVEKPKMNEPSSWLVHNTVEEPVNEEPEEVHVPEVEVHTPEPVETNETLDLSTVDQIDHNEEEKDAKEEKTPKPNDKENSTGKENQKSRRKSSSTNKTDREESNNGHRQTSPSIPSYMQATKSAKAKLRLQGSPKSPEEDVSHNTEKASVPRRHSLPSSGNSKTASQSPRTTTRLSNSGGKTGNKKEKKTLLSSREGNAKATPVERKR